MIDPMPTIDNPEGPVYLVHLASAKHSNVAICKPVILRTLDIPAGATVMLCPACSRATVRREPGVQTHEVAGIETKPR